MGGCERCAFTATGFHLSGLHALAFWNIFCRQEEFMKTLGWMDGCVRRRTFTTVEILNQHRVCARPRKSFLSPGRIYGEPRMDGWMDGCERRRTLTAIDFSTHALAL